MKNYTLTLPQNMIEVIGSGLGKLPLEVAAPTFNEVQRQVSSQEAEPEVPEPEEA